MNKLRGYKFKKYIYDTFAQHRVSGWGYHILVGIGASRIRFRPAIRVESKKGCHRDHVKKFLNMKHGEMTVAEYEKEFSGLSKYAPEPILIETFRCRQFEDGLKESIKRCLVSLKLI